MKILIIGANGYIGSVLFNKLKNKNIDVVGVDNYLRKDHSQIFDDILVSDFSKLDKPFLDNFTDCIWLSGYSSVKQAAFNPNDALKVNLFDLINFRKLFNGRFIYASSGSVYSNDKPKVCDELSETSQPQNMYDYTKISFDNYLIATETKGIGLRFGTVNGSSSNIKNELMINSMVNDAISKKEVNLMNSNFYRPILSLNDLINGLIQLLDSEIDTGIFNMCSFNNSIGEIASSVSDILGVKLNDRGSTKTYNFMMDNTKFQNTFNFQFSDNLEDIVKELKSFYE